MKGVCDKVIAQLNQEIIGRMGSVKNRLKSESLYVIILIGWCCFFFFLFWCLFNFILCGYDVGEEYWHFFIILWTKASILKVFHLR